MTGPQGKSGRQKDEWGCIWEKENPGTVGYVVGHPLDDWANWNEYRFPDPLAYWRWDEEELSNQVEQARKNKKYVICYAGNLFEKMQWLRGYENIMYDLINNKDRILLLGNKITDYLIKTIDKIAEFKLDAVFILDDWGTQQSLMIKPEVWREVYKPLYKKIFGRAHEHKLDVHFHTDGNTISIIPDLIEIGADVINPQLSSIDIEKLSKIVNGKVCVRTDVDRQYMLVKATSKQMDDYIKKIFVLLGSKMGGIIANGELNEDCSLEAIEAMYVAFEKYGKYH